MKTSETHAATHATNQNRFTPGSQRNGNTKKNDLKCKGNGSKALNENKDKNDVTNVEKANVNRPVGSNADGKTVAKPVDDVGEGSSGLKHAEQRAAFNEEPSTVSTDTELCHCH